jgi:hypothetical protein
LVGRHGNGTQVRGGFAEKSEFPPQIDLNELRLEVL